MCTSLPSVRRHCFVLAFLVLFSNALLGSSKAQSSSSSSPSSSSPSSSSGSGSKLGFAIESEMMTYSAMDAEAQGLACGIARNIGAADQTCTPRSGNGPAGGIVVITSPSSAVSQFQLWRTDISSMEMLTARAEPYCPKASARGAAGSSLGSTILSMIPGGQVMSFAQALFSTTSESAPLEGNIMDQTLLNDVAGHLRALGISVVIPDTYMPGALSAIDQRHSPYMSAISALLKARACLDAAAKGNSEGASGQAGSDEHSQSAAVNDADRKETALAIDLFLKSLSPAAAAPATASSTTQPAPAQPTISHLNAVLAADGLAQEIGARGGEAGAWYLLSLKALESGGTQHKSGNAILGSKTSYAGGAVGTYSLFHLAGSVVCSGVFYNYVTPMQDTKIPKMLESNQILPAGRLAGGCAPNQ
ncbi:MAG TPA: hypothetical protein VGF82_29995 [Terracidiphilus sp.]|jgi:hypothetical protein